ncbi:MAG: hypothetical protein IIA44_14655, partial [Acidobacteria bacterium]|nr:hypothetical protein [Acidobacteriota bacterium]
MSDKMFSLSDGLTYYEFDVVGDPPEGDQCANATDDDSDSVINDGCPVVLPVGEASACDGSADDDRDGSPNDGCPQQGLTAEAGSLCADPVDDDNDGFVNDGCPAIGNPEVGPACDDALDENLEVGDTELDGAGDAVNDGCPAVLVDPTPAESGAQCAKGDTVDDDKDGSINDGCPAVGKLSQVDLTVVDPNQLKNNQKLYWDTDDADQAGWWQVELGSIGPKATPEATPPSKLVTLNRLFSPPCGLVTEGVPPETAAPAPGTLQGVECVGDLQEGSYFHCISRIDEAPANVLESNVLCYMDAPLRTISGPQTALPSFADGNAGSPPPPPYTTASPSKLNGFVDKETQQIFLSGCFENVGGAIGPNMVWEMHVDAQSLKGFTDVWFNRSIDECNAKKPNPDDPPTLQFETVLARENIDFDHDGDGCSDYDELLVPQTNKCGDDPYNPYDSDADANGVVSIQVTQVRADWDKVNDELIPGFYFHCIANNTHDLATNAITSVAYCYTDNVVLTVNCEVVDGNVHVANGCPSTANTCPPAPADACGDGLLGSGPPAPFGDVDTSHTTGSGTY